MGMDTKIMFLSLIQPKIKPYIEFLRYEKQENVTMATTMPSSI